MFVRKLKYSGGRSHSKLFRILSGCPFMTRTGPISSLGNSELRVSVKLMTPRLGKKPW